MRKIQISLVLLLTFCLVLGITACGGDKNASNVPTTTSIASATIDKAAATTEEAATTTTEAVETTTTSKVETPATATKATVTTTTAPTRSPGLAPATWKEVPIGEPRIAVGSQMPFDLRAILTGASLDAAYSKESKDNCFNMIAFRGTIVGIKEFEYSWISDDKTERGPHNGTILEVKISKIYQGTSPVKDTFRRIRK